MAKNVAPQPTVDVLAEMEPTQVFKEIPQSQSTLTRNMERSKGIPTLDNVMMAYPEMPAIAHEFTTLLRLQFSTSFKIMEFLALQQIKFSQCMAKEHVERQMIKRALTGVVETEDERGLGKIGRMRNADEGYVRIELPPLNTTLVEVHRELATVWVGAKDMVCKNKTAKKAEKYANQQLEEAQKTIAELEHRLQEATASTTTAASHTPELQKLHEEVKAQTMIVAMVKKAAEIFNTEIERLWSELRQSLDRETNIRTKGRKAVKKI
mgnify:CR=1 FL=1